MEEIYTALNDAYLQIKDLIVLEGFYALVAGFIITTFVFKLIPIVKDMISEGKGFDVKHFYELGREYIFCIAIISLFPFLLNSLETILSFGADKLMKSLTESGVYNIDHIWMEPLKVLWDEVMEESLGEMVVMGPLHGVDALLTAILGSIFGVAYDYIMLVFLCTRYLILILLEVVSPIAIACLYNDEARSSFFTWMKSLIACYLLYPGFLVASIFSDLIVQNYIMKTHWPIVLMVCFSLVLKLSMLNTVRSTVNKWL